MNRHDLIGLSAAIFQFRWQDIQLLAGWLERTMDLSVTISEGSAYLATAQGECELPVQQLQ
ncbi:MAG: YaeQ family protein [Pseudomonadales bacterium]|nr:YaeQ family protein [Pseudomonadales bacterium]